MDAKTIRAAVCREFGKPLDIEEVLLSAPGPEEIEVAIEAVAICHSDISYADGDWGGPLPAVYGHEAAGRIRAVGAYPGPQCRLISPNIAQLCLISPNNA